jgi:hypothetical protein
VRIPAAPIAVQDSDRAELLLLERLVHTPIISFRSKFSAGAVAIEGAAAQLDVDRRVIR